MFGGFRLASIAKTLDEEIPPAPLAPLVVVISPLAAALVVGLLVILASMLGTLTRPIGQLASFWPPNALLLGLMLRDRRFAAPLCWLAALLGYMAADLLTGSDLDRAFLLTMANITGVGVGFLLASPIDPRECNMRGPNSVLFLLFIAVAGAVSSGLIGALTLSALYHRPFLSGWLFWSIADLINYVAIMPVVLTLPSLILHARERRKFRPAHPAFHIRDLAPFALLLASIAFVDLLQGPGAIAAPLPALLWCALAYPIFLTMLLSLAYNSSMLIAISLGQLNVGADVAVMSEQISVRLGVMLIALAPITAASVMAARRELLERLQFVADHDGLTTALNRHAFHQRCKELLPDLARARLPVAVLMLDLDRFKRVNDTYGHAAADKVLAAFSRVVANQLRISDVFGRLGGEEFAVILPDCHLSDALAIAERIRQAFANTATLHDDGAKIAVTVSIGIAHALPAKDTLDGLLSAADRALYRAKENGRNRVEIDRLD